MSAIKGKRCLITGGAGFIGSHMVDRLLAEGASHVSVIDNFFLGKEENLTDAITDITLYRNDAAETDTMKRIVEEDKPDIIFNLATKALLHSFDDPLDAYKVNVDIALNLGELLRAGAYEKLVHYSSSEVYGSAIYSPMDEGHPFLAETTYAAGKAAADLALSSYANMLELPILIIRPFNNYGPRQNDGNLAAIIPLTVKRIRHGGQPVLQGDGLQTRDFIFVKDSVDATFRLMEKAKFDGGVYNLGSGEGLPIKTLIETLCSLLDYKGNIKREPPRPADVREHCADMSKAKALIGNIATTKLEDGLKETLDWYAKHAA